MGGTGAPGTTTASLDEDIKIAAPEACVPKRVGTAFLAMNRARLITYEQVRGAIQAYIAALRSQFALKTVAAKNIADPMDVDRLGKGGKMGGKKGAKGQHLSQNPSPNKDVVCWHCGKMGHFSTKCWSNPRNQSGSAGGHHKGGEEKLKNSTGEGAGS